MKWHKRRRLDEGARDASLTRKMPRAIPDVSNLSRDPCIACLIKLCTELILLLFEVLLND